MKRKLIVLLVCGTIILTGTALIGGNNVQAAESNVSVAENSANTYVPDIIVDSNFSVGSTETGIKTYKTISEAVASVSENNEKEVKILIKNGTYKEKITVDKPNITFIGENSEKTIITFDAANGVVIPTEDGGDGSATYGTEGCATLTITENAKNFAAKDITIRNDFDEKAHSDIKNKQAVALKDDADNSMFVNCRFSSNQDTLYARTNKEYFKDCYIEGDVDFIFGAAQAVFENCEIKSLDREVSETTPKGYITAPSTLAENKYGFLIINSKLTSNVTREGSVYLGRPWHPSYETREVNSNVVYKNCEMGSHISVEGWHTMKNVSPLTNNMYEYGSTGAGALSSDTRRVLTDEQAAEYTPEKVLSDWDYKTKYVTLESYEDPKFHFNVDETDKDKLVGETDVTVEDDNISNDDNGKKDTENNSSLNSAAANSETSNSNKIVKTGDVGIATILVMAGIAGTSAIKNRKRR